MYKPSTPFKWMLKYIQKIPDELIWTSIQGIGMYLVAQKLERTNFLVPESVLRTK
jgi:hypothetical protein